MTRKHEHVNKEVVTTGAREWRKERRIFEKQMGGLIGWNHWVWAALGWKEDKEKQETDGNRERSNEVNDRLLDTFVQDLDSSQRRWLSLAWAQCKVGQLDKSWRQDIAEHSDIYYEQHACPCRVMGTDWLRSPERTYCALLPTPGKTET